MTTRVVEVLLRTNVAVFQGDMVVAGAAVRGFSLETIAASDAATASIAKAQTTALSTSSAASLAVQDVTNLSQAAEGAGQSAAAAGSQAAQATSTAAQSAGTTIAETANVAQAAEGASTRSTKAIGGMDEAVRGFGGHVKQAGQELGNWGIPFASSLERVGTTLEATKAQGVSTFDKLASAGGIATAVVTAATIGIAVESVRATDSLEVSRARLVTSEKNVGISATTSGDSVSYFDAKMEKLGITNATTENVLSRTVLTTKNLGSAEHDTAIGADVAAARHLDLESATQAVIRAQNGSYTSLIKLGIASKDQTKNFKDGNDAVAFLARTYQGQAAAATDTFTGKLKLLAAQGQDIAARIGPGVISVISGVGDALSGTVGFFESNDIAAKAFLITLGLFTTVLVGAFVINKIGDFITYVGRARDSVVGMFTDSAAATGADTTSTEANTIARSENAAVTETDTGIVADNAVTKAAAVEPELALFGAVDTVNVAIGEQTALLGLDEEALGAQVVAAQAAAAAEAELAVAEEAAAAAAAAQAASFVAALGPAALVVGILVGSAILLTSLFPKEADAVDQLDASVGHLGSVSMPKLTDQMIAVQVEGVKHTKTLADMKAGTLSLGEQQMLLVEHGFDPTTAGAGRLNEMLLKSRGYGQEATKVQQDFQDVLKNTPQFAEKWAAAATAAGYNTAGWSKQIEDNKNKIVDNQVAQQRLHDAVDQTATTTGLAADIENQYTDALNNNFAALDRVTKMNKSVADTAVAVDQAIKKSADAQYAAKADPTIANMHLAAQAQEDLVLAAENQAKADHDAAVAQGNSAGANLTYIATLIGVQKQIGLGTNPELDALILKLIAAGQHPVTVSVNDQAVLDAKKHIDDLALAYRAANHLTIDTTGGPASIDPKHATAGALGMMLSGAGVKTFATGGIEDHQAQMAPGGWPARVWAEPETGGESYIPHKQPVGKRQVDILKQTAAILGYGVVPMADGGLLGATPVPVAGAAAGPGGLGGTAAGPLPAVKATTDQVGLVWTQGLTKLVKTTDDQLGVLNTTAKTRFDKTGTLVTDTMKVVGDTMDLGAQTAGQRFVDQLTAKQGPLMATLHAYSGDILTAARSFLTTIGAPVPFASGGFSEDHSPHIATTVRMFGEPETGGEAYIPLGSSKRPQSEKLLVQVADMFGLGITKMASGGLVFPFRGGYTSGRIDQGWDIDSTSGAPVFAIAGGTISRVQQDPGGFGSNYPSLLTRGIGGPSPEVYYGHIWTSHGVGTSLAAGDQVGTTHTRSGDGDGGPGHLEIGFASGGSPLSAGAIMKALLTGAGVPGGDATGGTGATMTFTVPGIPAFGAGAPAAMAAAVATKMAAGLQSKMDALSAASSGPSGNVPGNLKGWIDEAIKETGVGMDWEGDLIAGAMRESGGDPHAVNNWDSNAKAGNPSKGLLQTTGSTFAAYALPGHGDIFNPVDNADAAIRYIQGRYHGDHSVLHHAYADGGIRVADQGAVLRPGLNVLDNQTGTDEPLLRREALASVAASRTPATVQHFETHLHVDGNIYGDEAFKQQVRDRLDVHDRDLGQKIRVS